MNSLNPPPPLPAVDEPYAPAVPKLPTGLRWALVVVALLHWALGASIGLSVDEAHYALYAAHPALSYFDHPPMVGWVQIPLVALQAPDALLRAIPGLLWWLAGWQVFRIAAHLQRLTGGTPTQAQRAGSWAVALLMLAPLLHILGVGLVPDTLLMVLHLALMAQTLRLMESPRPATRDWLLLGLLLGLAGLSKYTAIFSALAVLLCLLRAHGLRALTRRGPWLALLLALLLVLPVLVWNAQNQWVSFVYQAQHGAGGTWQALHLARFLVVQLLAYGPLLLVAVLAWGMLPGPWRWSLLFFALPFGVLAYLSGGGSSLPHWTAPAWVALLPVAGLVLARPTAAAPIHGGQSSVLRAVLPLGLRSVTGRTLAGVLLVVQLLSCLVLPALMLSAGLPWMAGRAASAQSSDPPNPFADLHGWELAGQRAQSLALEHQLSSLSVQNWTLASRLGWYARPLPVHVLEHRFDQFDLWAGDLKQGGSTLLVDWSQMPYETPLGAHGFARCQELARLPVRRWGMPLSEFVFHACYGWSGAPQPRLRNAAVAGAGPLAPGATPQVASPDNLRLP